MDGKPLTASTTPMVDDFQTGSSDAESNDDRDVPPQRVPINRDNGSGTSCFSSVARRWSNLYASITVEPVLLAFTLCVGLQEGATTNMFIERACLVVYNFTEDNCTGVLSTEVNRIVHPYVADLIMIRSIAESVVCASLSIFIGPWSDKNGRKPFIFLPLLGYFLSAVMWLVFIAIPSVPPLYFLLASVPNVIFGGYPALVTNIFCYMADITTDSNRAFRMTVINLGVSIGIFMGYGSTAVITLHLGSRQYFLLYGISSIVIFLALCYVGTGLSETAEQTKFFSFANVKDVLNSVYRKRTAKANSILLLLILVSCIYLMVLTGEMSYKYLIGMENFSWTLSDYSIYVLSMSAVGTLFQLPGLYVTTVCLNIKESNLSVIIILLTLYSAIVLTFSQSTFDFYLASLLGTFTGLIVPLIKSQTTRIVQKSDTGKFFSFISILESICPLLSSPLYNAWYSISLENHHSLRLFYLSALLWAVAAMFFVGITILEFSNNGANYNRLSDSQEESEETVNQQVTPERPEIS